MKILLFICMLLHPFLVFSVPKTDINQEILSFEKRTILALYKGSETPTGIVHHPLHRFLEMPLNHLGLKVTYWDITKGLPDLTQYPDLRGIMSWYLSDDMENPKEYLRWAKNSVDSGLKFLVIGLFGCERDKEKNITPLYEINQFSKTIGLELLQGWQTISYDVNFVTKFPFEIEFEQKLTQKPMGLPYFRVIDPMATIMLYVSSDKDTEPPLPSIIYGPRGGYIPDSLMIAINPETSLARWNTNPFYYLKKIFGTKLLPKPDVSTLNGNRIFFSHIDGDGWQSNSYATEFKHKSITCAEVIYKKVVQEFSDLPVTIAPIAADLDPTWHGTMQAVEIAKKIFEAPNVEAGTHTYSHPLFWNYYDDPKAAERELKEYGRGRSHSFLVNKEKDVKKIGGYALPRAFLEKTFDLDNEIQGSVNYIKKLLPPGKDLRLVQWSGDCEPFEKAIHATRKAKLLNMNGGDSRFDEEYPSYSSVSPIGREVGKEHQIYAGNSNENTYTSNWTERFFGFKYLKSTIRNTESPIRLKPINIYYHMYSGENDAALNALLGNLSYAQKQEIIPIEASLYAEMADSFYTIQFLKLSDHSWQIKNHGKIQTIRFDQASDYWVDFKKSKGIIGARHLQGSLYLFLDLAEENPILTLEYNRVFGAPPLSSIPYLLSSNWQIWDVRVDKESVSFKTKGYGNGQLRWVIPHEGICKVTAQLEGSQDASKIEQEIEISKDKMITISDLKNNNKTLLMTISKK